MPWNNQSGGNRGRGPWGQGPSGGAQPPDLEELLKRSQDRLKQALPGGGFSGGSLAVALVLLVVVWVGFTGWYTVQPAEQGVVLRFGKYVARTGPGFHFKMPWPIDEVQTPQVTNERFINIGFGDETAFGRGTRSSDVPEESLMLTGDENIVDVDYTVFWVINDAPNFLFNVENPEAAVKAVAESAMREVVGRNQIELILTENRSPIETEVRTLMQQMLDAYGAGVTVTRVQLGKVDPPAQVLDSYRDVQAARADQERLRNEAEAYANKVIPEARGQAERIIQNAEAYKQQVIAESQGEASRFLAIYEEYRKAPEVTRRRIYLETLEEVLSGTNKVVVDGQSATGVVPYLPLPELDRRRNAQEAVQ